jgi:hypothetical protein
MVVNNGTVINLKYNNISGNVITLTTTVGASVIAGSTVVSPIVSRPNLPPGSAYSVFQKSRLVISAGQQTENTVYVSYFGEPESQLEDDTVNSAVQSEVNKGRGGIIDIEDFGEYLMIRKNDVSFRYYFSFSSDMTTFEPASDTVVTGDGTGPVNQGANINYMNAVYSVTASEGIVRIYPDTTGTQTTTKLELKSRNVQNLVTEVLDFTDARTAAYRQKIYFACSNPILKDVKTPNNAVLVYDVLRDSWVIFKNWNCADIKKVNDKLIMLSLNDGGLYECLTTYQDMVGTNVLPYTASLSTKRMDFGEPSSVSKNQYLYVQGIITTNTTFYVDVLYNEGGYLGIVTYKIDGSDTKIAHKVVKGGLGVFPFAVPLLGGVDLLTMKSLQDPAFFRCYLQLNQSFVVSSLQARCYSVEAGSYWGITNMTTITQTQQDIIPTSLVVGPSEAPQS